MTLYTIPVRAYRMEVRDDRGGQHEIFAMPLNERLGLMNALKDIALKTYGTDRRKRAWENYFACDDLICDLRSAFSSTVHRSQGSTYIDVFIDASSLTNSNALPILQGLCYTAVTRPSRTAVVAK
jgi:hypothetical protein